jgi:hypothetical protein
MLGRKKNQALPVGYAVNSAVNNPHNRGIELIAPATVDSA